MSVCVTVTRHTQLWDQKAVMCVWNMKENKLQSSSECPETCLKHDADIKFTKIFTKISEVAEVKH